MSAQKRILIALSSHGVLGSTGRATGFYVPEAAHPHKVFVEAGHQVDFVSVAGGRPPQEGIKPDDRVVGAFLARPEIAQQLANTPTAADLDPADYDAILFAGGHGTMWDFPDAKDLTGLAAAIYERGGVVAAVCHGPAALVNLALSDGSYLVAGRRVASFTDEEEAAVGLTEVVPFLLESALIERGATVETAPNFAEQVVVDGRLITGQNPASSAKVAVKVLESLAG
ncbi:type 1 glutamine amidotransferase domain-containing protein [Solihabitans fulvus]|uniref:Type 1 glutamine amidotransferase domain-containing protein n=1 Tax=Solihabitans fulvus TaxID=1892852 RepID=A0A5B2XBR9_9PSEU|nr:type 1 glutamine amidotransferase domain-containing protein [Solihabitans fulvus]KAA2260646.1 type 1 glutamine amidotransferase domain-containing protein [Solihabitans fulvus]